MFLQLRFEVVVALCFHRRPCFQFCVYACIIPPRLSDGVSLLVCSPNLSVCKPVRLCACLLECLSVGPFFGRAVSAFVTICGISSCLSLYCQCAGGKLLACLLAGFRACLFACLLTCLLLADCCLPAHFFSCLLNSFLLAALSSATLQRPSVAIITVQTVQV